MEIQQISKRIDITGMITLRNRLFFFTKDGLYLIELPEKEPWYKRVWNWVRKRGRQ